MATQQFTLAVLMRFDIGVITECTNFTNIAQVNGGLQVCGVMCGCRACVRACVCVCVWMWTRDDGCCVMVADAGGLDAGQQQGRSDGVGVSADGRPERDEDGERDVHHVSGVMWVLLRREVGDMRLTVCACVCVCGGGLTGRSTAVRASR